MTKNEIKNNYSKQSKGEFKNAKRGEKPFDKGNAFRGDSRSKRDFKPRENIEERSADMPVNTEIICGRNPVLEALRSERPINKVLLAQGQDIIFTRQIKDLCKVKGVPCQESYRMRMDKIAAEHRGVIAYVAPYAYKTVEDMLALAKQRNESPLIVILAEVEDPHNLGAVIRTAECVGAHGIIIPKHRAVPMTETVTRVAAGAAEYVPVARVANLVHTMKGLKENGIWIASNLWKSDLKGPLAIVLGSEGQGIPRLVAENCDFMVELPMKGNITSLNVSTTAGVILYEVMRQRDFAGK
jgi:23S rRNA (guanosine2251-2'-O)-methyltransferase